MKALILAPVPLNGALNKRKQESNVALLGLIALGLGDGGSSTLSPAPTLRNDK